MFGSIVRHTSSKHTASRIHIHLHLVVVETTDEDVVGILKDAHLFGSDVTQDAHGKTRTREGVTVDEMFGHTHLATHTAHFVLEQPLEWFANLEVHLFGKTSHVVVTLDDLSGDVERLDAVGIDGALCQPLRISNLHSFSIEDVDETSTDDFTLAFGFFHTSQFCEELFASIHTDYVKTEAFVVFHHCVKLVLAEHTMVHKDTSEVAADGLVEQHRSYRRVHTTGETENHAGVAELLLELSHSRFNERGGAPVLAATTDVDHKVAEQSAALE